MGCLLSASKVDTVIRASVGGRNLGARGESTLRCVHGRQGTSPKTMTRFDLVTVTQLLPRHLHRFKRHGKTNKQTTVTQTVNADFS